MIIKSFPNKFLNLTKIDYYDVECLPSIRSSECIHGIYNHIDATIELAAMNKDASFSLTHEIGHYLWNRVMDESDRELWSKYYSNYGATTLYGETDVWEDFADYFAFIDYGSSNITSHIVRSREQEKENLMDSILSKHPVFDIRNFTKDNPRNYLSLVNRTNTSVNIQIILSMPK